MKYLLIIFLFSFSVNAEEIIHTAQSSFSDVVQKKNEVMSSPSFKEIIEDISFLSYPQSDGSVTYRYTFRYNDGLSRRYYSPVFQRSTPPLKCDVYISYDECEPKPKNCSELSDEFKQEQFICQSNNPNSTLYDVNFEYSCEDVLNSSPNIKITCNYVPNDCIEGFTCDDSSDDSICNPNIEDCSLPDMSDPDDIPEFNPDIPDSEPSLCEQFPSLCLSPDTDVTDVPNETPDSSQVPDNDNFSSGENSLYKEAVVTNQYLENIDHRLSEFSHNYDSISGQNNEIFKNQLGQLRLINHSSTNKDSKLNEISSSLSGIHSSLNTPFCSKNPNHPDCNKSPFGQLPEFTESNHFSSVFDSNKFNELAQKKDDLTQQIQEKITQFRNDLNVNFSFGDGSFLDENLTVSGRWGSVTTSNSYWSDNSGLIKSAVVALCSLIAFSIVIIRKR